MPKNRNLFRLTRFIIFNCTWLFKFFGEFRSAEKRILVVKCDAIGDYILFRNFLEVLRSSDDLKDYSIDLVGNELWKDIVLTYDKQFVNKLIFIKPLRLYYQPLKVLKLGWTLYKNNYAFVINPTYTRTLLVDGLAGLATAKQTIGFQSDNEGLFPKYKIKTDRFYSEKYNLPQNIYFEFDRTKYFFQTFLKKSVQISGPYFNLNKVTRKDIVIAPGSAEIRRSWNAEKFRALLELIIKYTTQTIVLVGGNSEIEIGNYLTETLPTHRINNLIGKTSLPDLIDIVASANLLVANDSSTIHIAAATNTASVCILGGGHFDRFSPYPPQSVPVKPVCIYVKMECYFCNWICKFKTEPNEAFPCIDNISVEKVWEAVYELLV